MRDFVFKIRASLAEHRIAVAALFGVFSSPFLAQWIRTWTTTAVPPWVWLLGFVIAYMVVAIASTSPAQYAKIELLEAMLPTIAAVLELNKQSDRLTIHHLKSKRKEKYEQLTNYWPTSTGRGRVYTFSQGIVGRVFKTRTPNLYLIPAGKSFEVAMKDDWSFSGVELSRLTKDRRAFFAFPIGSDGEIARAVLYMDSSTETTLVDKDIIIQKINEMFLRQLEAILRA